MSFITKWIGAAAGALGAAAGGGKFDLGKLIMRLLGSVPDLIEAGKAGPVENRKAWIDAGIETADFSVGFGGVQPLPHEKFTPELQEWISDRLLQIAQVALYVTNNIPLQELPQSFFDRDARLATSPALSVSAGPVLPEKANGNGAPDLELTAPSEAQALAALIASSSPVLQPGRYQFKETPARLDDMAGAVLWLLKRSEVS